jgi:hypothetical protein
MARVVSLPRPGSPQSRLGAAAAEVLRENDTGHYTVPSRLTYPHQWNWDSALIALGWAELDAARAWIELEALMGCQDPSGLVPHVAFQARLANRLARQAAPPRARLARPGVRYMPGPRWWGRRKGADGRRISAITQPPVAATCARLLFERRPDERAARGLLRPLLRWHRFLLRERDPLGLGEPTLIHPWESGRDNAVEWDAPLWRVMPEVTVLRRRDTKSVAASERPSNEHYRRYLTLVRRGTALGWPQERLARSGAFRVLDPGFGAILARASADLAWLAEQLHEEAIAEESAAAAERVSSAMRARADSDGLVRPVDLVSGVPSPVTSAGSALVLLAPSLDAAAARAARELVMDGVLASAFGVRSLERDHPELAPRNYWRGPVWANITWLCALGLELAGEADAASDLRAKMLRAVGSGGMREYFEPGSGHGLGARDFAWTAALALRELSAAAGLERAA